MHSLPVNGRITGALPFSSTSNPPEQLLEGDRGVAAQIRQRRQQAGRTQRQLAATAGIATAHLSRLENDRVTPTLRTVSRLATALGVSVASLVDRDGPLELPDRCPVSLSGRCILDEPAGRRRRQRGGGRESYTPEDLKALRLCNLLFQSGNRQAVRTLIAVLNGLLAMKPDAGE